MKIGCFYRIETWMYQDQFNHLSCSTESPAQPRAGNHYRQQSPCGPLSSHPPSIRNPGRFSGRGESQTEIWTAQKPEPKRSFSSSLIQARIIRCGCSRLARNLSRNREASSSSTRRPSLDRVTVISCWVRRVWSSSHSRSSDLEVPTARMHDWGGLMTALKPLIPNIPRLDMLQPGPARM